VLDHQVCHTVVLEQASNGVRHRGLSSVDREGIHSKHTPKRPPIAWAILLIQSVIVKAASVERTAPK